MDHHIKKVLLIILDGFGLAPQSNSNPIGIQLTCINSLIANYPSYAIEASGLVVGLPMGTFGNSEVGHCAIGTGRIVVQDLSKINAEIQSGEFFKNPAFMQALAHAKKHNSNVHVIGCVSPGGIHSHENHAHALLKLFTENHSGRTFLHMITDGEDCSQEEGLRSYHKLLPFFAKGNASMGSIIGRQYGMDRLLNWDMTKRVWGLIVGEDFHAIESPENYFKKSYIEGIGDYEMEPVLVVENKEVGKIKDNDAVVFFNYRNDRMKQLVGAFVLPDFSGFDRGTVPKNLCVVTMSRFDETFDTLVAYAEETIPKTLGEVISDHKLKQLRVAEQEKASHVTSFFNGGRLEPFPLEDRIIVPSQKLSPKDYMDNPGMAADSITRMILENIKKDYSLIVANFANADMLGHTGDFNATRKALQLLDMYLQKILSEVDLSKVSIVITADHGNAEELVDPLNGRSDTQHSSAHVPLIIVAKHLEGDFNKNIFTLAEEPAAGALLDIAPTVLSLLGIVKPHEMIGEIIGKI